MSTPETEPYKGSTRHHAIEDVGTYPRPPLLQRLDYPISITLSGQRIVETSNAYRVLETYHPPTYYIPPDDVAARVLRPSAQRSMCEWKGPARYFDVSAGSKTLAASAWCYGTPVARFAAIKDYLAFYCHPMDACLVDGVEASPQPGNFYGGWVTPWITGPIKGAPGTNGW